MRLFKALAVVWGSVCVVACVIITGDNNKVVKQPSVESVIGKDGIIPDAKKKLD